MSDKLKLWLAVITSGLTAALTIVRELQTLLGN